MYEIGYLNDINSIPIETQKNSQKHNLFNNFLNRGNTICNVFAEAL